MTRSIQAVLQRRLNKEISANINVEAQLEEIKKA